LDIENDPRTFRELERLLGEGVKPKDIAVNLAGMNSDKAWDLRTKLETMPGTSTALAKSLAGLDTQRAWERRELLLNQRKWAALAFSLTGLDNDRAVRYRDAISNASNLNENDYKALQISLAGCDSDDAWRLRSKSAGAPYFQSLTGVEASFAWADREGLYTTGVIAPDAPKLLADSLVGLDSDRAWQMREDYLNKQGYMLEYIRSIAGIDTERAETERKKFLPESSLLEIYPTLNMADYRMAFAESLSGVTADYAWELRRSFPYIQNNEELAKSINGNWILAGVKKANSSR
jgi:hypothetical protein